MTFPTLTATDFDVFTIQGLEPRMHALIENVRPKLHHIGEQMAPWLSAACGEPMFAHVARHARRTINAPNDTWVAWSNNKKGYKAHPHFQVGLWSTHLFIQFAIIYECDSKARFANHVLDKLHEIRQVIPASYFWSGDHMDPSFTLDKDLSDEELAQLMERLKTVKKAELLCGLELKRDDVRLAHPGSLMTTIEETFEKVMPLYRLAM
ncbi:MAG: yktB [Paenibacillus sp.]|nr:yktB [Paenibacillus sp.]